MYYTTICGILLFNSVQHGILEHHYKSLKDAHVRGNIYVLKSRLRTYVGGRTICWNVEATYSHLQKFVFLFR